MKMYVHLIDPRGLIDKTIKVIDKTVEVVDSILTDQELEGKKEGYARAAKEYTKAFNRIKRKYKKTEKLFINEEIANNILIEALIIKLEKLKQEQEKLKKRKDNQIVEVSQKFNIPASTIISMGSNLITSGYGNDFSLLDTIYNYRMKKRKEAEQKGYLRAKDKFEDKLDKLRSNFNNLLIKGNIEAAKYLDLINEILEDISGVEKDVAELKIILGE